MTHELKILPEYFEAVQSGKKTFEVRDCSDRNFCTGDMLLLKEIIRPIPDEDRYTGREILVDVTYCYFMSGATWGSERLVVMAIKKHREWPDMTGDSAGILTCPHEWQERDSQFSNEYVDDVRCVRCGMSGERDRKTNEVFFPAT